MNAYACVAALTMQLCGYQPTPAMVEQVYDVWFHRPVPGCGHAHYVANAMCEAFRKPFQYGLGADCRRVNNVCID